MALASSTNILDNFSLSQNFGVADHWGGSFLQYSSDFPGIFFGGNLNWGTFDSQGAISPFQNQPYSGYSSNWGGFVNNNVIGAFANEKYAGYTTNWGSYSDHPLVASITDVDNNTFVDYPKAQKVYYKLKGYNELTQEYESWIVIHNVTGRPALDGGLFDPDPGRQPPNIERDVFKTPPSGNNLVNIVIVGRWFE